MAAGEDAREEEEGTNIHGCGCWAVEYLNADDTLGVVVRVFGVIEMSILEAYLCETYWVCEQDCMTSAAISQHT